MNDFDEIVGIKTRFENSTEQELFSYLYSFQNKWVLLNNKNITVLVEKAIENFGLDPEKFTFSELQEKYEKCLYNIVYLQQSITSKTSNDDRYEE
jgi:hypothetical protein